MNAGAPAAEAVELLSRLIRFNTVNPPGNERPAQEFLAEHLASAGFDCELLGAEPGRPNLLARLSAPDGAEDGPTLCYLGHVDTVLADAGDWSHDPCDHATRGVAEGAGVKAGLLINAIRVAIVGQAVAPPHGETAVSEGYVGKCAP